MLSPFFQKRKPVKNDVQFWAGCAKTTGTTCLGRAAGKGGLPRITTIIRGESRISIRPRFASRIIVIRSERAHLIGFEWLTGK